MGVIRSTMHAGRARRYVAVIGVLSLMAFYAQFTLAAPASANHGARTLDVTVSNSTNPGDVTASNDTYTVPTGDSVTVTATLSSAAPAADNIFIDFEVISGVGETDGVAGDSRTSPDYSCTITGPASSCSISISGAGTTAASASDIVGWIDHDQSNTTDESDGTEGVNEATTPGATAEPDDTDRVAINWDDRTPTTATITQNTSDPQPTGGSHSFTGNVKDQFGDNVASQDVRWEVTVGAGTATPANEDALTDGSGNDNFSYSNNTASTDTVEFCVDNNTSNNVCDAPEVDDTETATWVTAAATGINSDPETGSNALGVSHTVNTDVYDQGGNLFSGNTLIELEFFSGSPSDTDGNTPATPDRTCNTSAANNCDITWSQSTTAGTDRACIWTGADPTLTGNNTNGTCDDPDGTVPDEGLTDSDETGAPSPPEDSVDVVTKTWTTGAALAGLNCTPDQDGNPTGTDHLITCVLGDNAGNAINNANIDVEFTGANDPDNTDSPTTPDVSCTTDVNGSCSFHHNDNDDATNPSANPAGTSTDNTGTSTYRAWHDTDNNNATVEADTTEGQCAVVNEDGTGCTPAQPGGTAEPDRTDVMTKNWFGEAFRLTLEPETDSAAVGECNEYTVTLTDSGGNPVSGAVIDVEQVHADHTPATGNTEPDVSFCTSAEVEATQAGDNVPPNPAGVREADGDDVDGIGAADDTDGDASGETFCEAAPDDDCNPGANQPAVTDANGKVSFGIKSTGTGTVTVTAFCEDATRCPSTNNDDPDGAEPQDTATKTWNPGGADNIEDVDAEPETDSNTEGTTHTFRVTLRNAAGNLVGGVQPSFQVTAGPNAGTKFNAGGTNTGGTSCVVVSTGVWDCTYADNTPTATPPGTDTIRVWVNQSAASGGGTPGHDAGEPFDDIQKTWVGLPTNVCLDAEPETDLNARTEEHLITVTVLNQRGTANDDTCEGDPVEGASVEGNIADDDPDAFFSQVNGAPTGGTGGNPDTVTGSTGANGQATFSVRLADPNDDLSPSDINDAIQFRLLPGGVNDTDQPTDNQPTGDTVSKRWAIAGQAAILEVTPETDTNQVNTPHVLTARVTDPFGTPVSGTNVDFTSLAGSPDQNEFRQCTTGADGTCTVTYQAGSAGDSDYRAHIDANTDNAIPGEADTTEGRDAGNHPDEPIGPNTPGGTPEPDNTDRVVKRWTTAAPSVGDVEVDMEGCNGAQGDLSDTTTWNATADPNPVPGFHEICATVTTQTVGGTVLLGQNVTFTSTGVGHLADRMGTPHTDLGTTFTVPVGPDGYAHIWLHSEQSGNQNIQVTADTQTDSGVKPWQALDARTIDAEPETDTNDTGTNHTVTITVRDRLGNPVAGENVVVEISGVGEFSDGTCCQKVVTTGPDGTASVTITSDAEGTTTVTATLEDDLLGEPDVDECDRAANDPAGAPAGVCSDTVEKDWEEPVVEPDECPGQEGVPGNHQVGTEGPDRIEGTAGDDVQCGLGDDDELIGGGGDDIQIGDEGRADPANFGDDLLDGGIGDDQQSGDAGDDTLIGGPGNDSQLGGTGNDNALHGGPGDDFQRGGGGTDVLNGGAGNDTQRGGPLADVLRGGTGEDDQGGQIGNDLLRGGADDDLVRGWGGNDDLFGGPNDDRLVGGPGNDFCNGGGGNDQFVGCEQVV